MLVTVVLCWSLSFSQRRRQVTCVFTAMFLVAAVYLARDPLLEIMSHTLFEGQQREISTTQLSALSNYSFISAEKIISALLDPKFLVITLVAKFTSFSLGPHPFSRVEEGGANILDFFSGQFQSNTWGGCQWEDVLLVYGLQWIPQFILLPCLVTGLVGILRYNDKALIALASIWVTYAALTIFSGNEWRWGLPMMLVYYVVLAMGYGLFGFIKSLWLFSASISIIVVLVRAYGLPVPMIVIPIALLSAVFIIKVKPISAYAKTMLSVHVTGSDQQHTWSAIL
jgi:hypothetical protein